MSKLNLTIQNLYLIVYLIQYKIMKKYLYMAWLCLGGSVMAQEIWVKDSITGKPVSNVMLSDKLSKKVSYTDDAGKAYLPPETKGDVEIFAIGYYRKSIRQEDLQQLGFQILLSPKPWDLGEHTVSATRWLQPRNSSSIHLNKMRSEQISFYQPQTAADLLSLTGEVFIQKSQQGGGSPMIRGFATNRLLYSVDGVRMNNAIFRAGNLQQVISLDPFSIQSSEVLFGPGSVMYGSDAIGGVMYFSTLDPQPGVRKGSATMRMSSANEEQTAHIHLNFGGKDWASLTSLTYSNYGDLRMGSHGPEDYLRPWYVMRMDSADRVVTNDDARVQRPSGYDQMNLMQKVLYQGKRGWKWQLNYHLSETSPYARYDRLIEWNNGNPRSAVWNYGPQIWRMGHLTVESGKGNAWYDRMRISLSNQHFEESRIDRNFSGGQRYRLREQKEVVEAYALNVDWNLRRGKHKYGYGLEAVLNEVFSDGKAVNIQTGADIPVPDRYPQSAWYSYAVYGSDHYQLNSKWSLEAGVRYSYYGLMADFSENKDFFPFDYAKVEVQKGALTGNIGAVCRPTETWVISTHFSTGFRAPNVDDMGKFFDFQPGEVILPNPDLKAEFAMNGELNISRSFSQILRIDINAYYTRLNQGMVRRPYSVNGQDSIVYDGQMSRIYAIQNSSYTKVMGGNINAECKLKSGFSLSTRYSIQKGTEIMDDGSESAARHAAPAFGMSTLRWKNKNLEWQLYSIYVAEVSFDNLNVEERSKTTIYASDKNGNPYAPSWMTLNVKMSYSAGEYLIVSGGVENLTDRRYKPYSSGIAAAGRNFMLAISTQF